MLYRHCCDAYIHMAQGDNESELEQLQKRKEELEARLIEAKDQ